jgi:threonine/homoserine/homoserine lactone efflux protein
MPLELWLSLVAICLLGAMSPGPSLAVMINTVVHSGRRTAYGSAVAHGLGVGLYALFTVTGLAVLIAGSPAAFTLIQVLGACYLLYLGIQSLRRSSRGTEPADAKRPAVSRPAAMDGFWIAFLNPKVAIFMLALFSQFLRPEAGLVEKCTMVVTVIATDASWYALVVTLVSHRTLLEALERRAALIDRIFGVLIILLALTVLLRALPGS